MGAITTEEMWRLRWVHWLNRRRWAFGTVAPAEMLYQQLFDAAVARSGIAVPPLYPVGGAANASLLYLLLRLLGDFPALNVLELGAGQSSLLLDALARAGRGSSVTTLEHDPQWAAYVRGKVAHEVILAPLRDEMVLGRTTQAYGVVLDRRFDAVLVDGPVGTPRWSRRGALKLLEAGLADEFVVIFDDAERPGERETIARFLELQPHAGHVFVHAMKSQCVVFTKKYRLAASY